MTLGLGAAAAGLLALSASQNLSLCPTPALLNHPVILFGMGFANRGFTWAHGALFAAMISSTDALAATAILKQGACGEPSVRAGVCMRACA